MSNEKNCGIDGMKAINNKRPYETEEQALIRETHEWQQLVKEKRTEAMNMFLDYLGSQSKTVDMYNAQLLGAILQNIEEQAELIQAQCKLLRVIGIGQKTELTHEKAMENLVEELADTAFTHEQLRKVLGVPDNALLRVDEQKIKKVTNRIKEA